MQEQYQQLITLINTVPDTYSYKSSSELNVILNKYTLTLNYLNGYNDAYKRATNIYYTGISNITDNIGQSVTATTNQEKALAFAEARNQLKKDLQALATLIQPKDDVLADIPLSIITPSTNESQQLF